MSMISTGDLARLRSQANELLPDTCTIQTKTASADGIGGETYSWANAATGVACRLNRADTRNDPRPYGERMNIEADWVVSMAHNQAVTINQRVIVNSLTLEPVWVNTGKSVEAQTRLVCRELS